MIEVAESLIVKFGAGANTDGLVKLELDEKLNEGKTSFAPGDIINIRLQHDASLQLEKMLATDGMILSQGVGSRDLEEQLLFVEASDTHDLGYLVSGGLSVDYFGRQAEGLRRVGNRLVTITGGDLPSLALVKYSAVFSLFKLLAPTVELADDESYPVTIVAYMGAV